MTESTHAKIPVHLRKFVVDQNYERYTPEDQAVWRHIMGRLNKFLKVHAHESYADGVTKTGITLDRIPRIDEIDEHLESFGWGAVPVSGFIPPAAFMEFQAIGVLPIASDMRALDHLLYTPAPDIVHEAAGHAPILIHPEYAKYLRSYGDVARNSILCKEDLEQYEAIRILSDIKEDPRSTKGEIQKAEQRLSEINKNMPVVSEAALLSRMNWWTAEYGLIGELGSPKIFGAGLLSSIGEARACLDAGVKKIPLSISCVDYAYDITEQQPQLFVAENFGHLTQVLEDLASRLSFRRGGLFGLKKAIESRTVNTVELDSGLQIAGVVVEYLTAPNENSEPVFLRFAGPSQLAIDHHELEGHGCRRHPQGFSTPLGKLHGQEKHLHLFSAADLEDLGLRRGQRGTLKFQSGIKVEGQVESLLFKNEKLILITWSDCKVCLGDRVLFEPAWGAFDMAVGAKVKSVFGGPADRTRFGAADEFVNKRVPNKVFTSQERDRHKLYADIRALREGSIKGKTATTEFEKLRLKFLASETNPWLMGLELMEIGESLNLPGSELLSISERLPKDGNLL